jgi:ABC-type sugar transport system substrate-binding protein
MNPETGHTKVGLRRRVRADAGEDSHACSGRSTRRKLIVALAAVALGAPLAAFAQQTGKVWRIGFLGTVSASGFGPDLKGPG